MVCTNIFSFQVKFTSIDWVPNFENTRWFLIIRLEAPPANELNKLLGICNETGREYGKAPLYEDPAPENSPPTKRTRLEASYQSAASHPKKEQRLVPTVDEKFHISIAWTLTPPSQKIRDMTKVIEESKSSDLKTLQIEVKEMKVKIGNVVTSIRLPEKVKLEKGLFG